LLCTSKGQQVFNFENMHKNSIWMKNNCEMLFRSFNWMNINLIYILYNNISFETILYSLRETTKNSKSYYIFGIYLKECYLEFILISAIISIFFHWIGHCQRWYQRFYFKTEYFTLTEPILLFLIKIFSTSYQ
jgi:hypothetical protein